VSRGDDDGPSGPEAKERDFDARMRRVELLVEELERRGGEAAEAARTLLAAVLDLHEAGLARALDVIASQGEAGRVVTAALVADPRVASVLLLHGLHPEPVEARVRAAVAALAIELRREGASLELVEIGADSVRLRLVRDAALGNAAIRVEQALVDAAPDAPPVHVDDVIVSALVPAARLVHGPSGGPA
jgi:hypothetical protein